jgi:hypothetical protein
MIAEVIKGIESGDGGDGGETAEEGVRMARGKGLASSD